MKPRVLILGCGPAGLFAAQAATDNGAEIAIVSKKRKSEMFGAQYLHQPIPNLSAATPVKIRYELRGTVEGYRRKVYGDRAVTTSPETLETDHWAWDIRTAYNRAWDRFGDSVQDYQVLNGYDLHKAMSHLSPDYVVSSIPRTTLCMDQEMHTFKSEDIWAKGDAPERDSWCPVTVPENTVVCNGEDAPSWYRASNVFGYKTAEWPGRRKPPIEGVAVATKPLAHNCDCHDRITFVGRYGKWTKGVLSHDAYFDTRDMLQPL